MSSNGRNRGYIGRNEITSPKGVIDGRQNYLNEEPNNWNYGTDWVRPTDWIPMPGYTFGEQVAYGLLAITDDELDSNSVGLAFAGNYIVDWGDGTTGSFSSGTTVRKSYNYSSISSSTLTTEGFKQVLIKITPQSGANITSVNFSPTGITSASAEMASKWLEFDMNVPNATSITLRQSSLQIWLKKVTINRASASWTDWRNLLNGCLNVESVYLPQNIKPFFIGSIFQSCRKLKQAPYIDTSNCSNFTYSFLGCGIEALPPYNFRQLASATQPFASTKIKSIPFVLNADIGGAGGSQQFSYSTVEYIKGYNAPNLTTTNSIFEFADRLKQIDGLTLTSATNIWRLFNGCASLERVNNFAGGTSINDARSAFENCGSLISGVSMYLENCTNSSRMYRGCSRLESVPAYKFGNGANLSAMFAYCYSLKKLPEMDFGNIAIVDSGSGDTQRFTYFCFNLEKFPVKNLRVSMSLLNCRFGFTGLSEVFSGLTGISGPSATLNITGNPGAAFITSAQIASATALGWTITR